MQCVLSTECINAYEYERVFSRKRVNLEISGIEKKGWSDGQ